jgi:hypothetical protein
VSIFEKTHIIEVFSDTALGPEPENLLIQGELL